MLRVSKSSKIPLTASEILMCSEIKNRPQLYDENSDMYLSRNSDKLKIYEEIAAIIIVSHPNEVFWSGKFIVYTVNIFSIYLIQK